LVLTKKMENKIIAFRQNVENIERELNLYISRKIGEEHEIRECLSLLANLKSKVERILSSGNVEKEMLNQYNSCVADMHVITAKCMRLNF